MDMSCYDTTQNHQISYITLNLLYISCIVS